MIDYENMPDEGMTSRRCGWAAATLYVVVVVLAMWLVRCESRSELTEDASSGMMMISLGDVAVSSGERLKAPAKVATPPKPTPKVEQKPQLTDEQSEVESPVAKSTETPKPAEAEPTEQKAEEVVEAKPREVNRRALFPGSSNTKNDAGQGESKEVAPKGSAGSNRGTPDKGSSLGEGLTGNYSLTGRSLIGSLPVPAYTTQAEGRVVIAITVDEKGRVTSASLQPSSSTTNNSRLIAAAREAALKARFDQSEEFIQGGTITYIFKMN